jgi:aspartate racemase
MKKIGIIGGAGPEAGILLFKNIISLYQQQGSWQDNEFPLIHLLNYPFSSMLDVGDAKFNQQRIVGQLQSTINVLEKIPVDIIAIACNTLHTFIPLTYFQRAQLVNMVECTLNNIKSFNIKKVLFLGTSTSVSARLYKDPDIDIIYLSNDKQDLILECIIRVLKNRHSSYDALILSQIINDYRENNEFGGVILGCTELSIIHQMYPIQTMLKVFDTLQILALYLVR